MTKRLLIAASLVAALAGGGAVAIAQAPQSGPGMQRGPGGPGPRGPRGPGADFGLRGVELTDAQREQVRAIRESHKTELEQTRSRMLEAHRAFAEAVRADAFDEGAVRARSAAIATAMADEAILQARIRAQVHGVLTAEQLQQLADRRAKAGQRSKEQRQQAPRRPQRTPGF